MVFQASRIKEKVERANVLPIKGTKVASGITIATTAGTPATKVVVTIGGKALATQDFTDGVELRAQKNASGVPTIDIVDGNNNLIDITNPIRVSL
ncbi:hypothetical protein AN963_16635 [Brevibacillus choshinensis]|uniref:Uncharacterized protein n=2 Tax=Brevibacillus choshinensis TaxID=54911 RepID=A0ABR5N7E8_BRECH|nr:hypothetical protein AN963_16635 [Brevibacillus choshinensis]